MTQRRYLLSFRVRLALALKHQKHAILPFIVNAPETPQPHLLIDHNLDAQLFTLAQALFHILLRPKPRRCPTLRQQKRHLIAPLNTLRMQERRKLPGFRYFLIRQLRTADPLPQIHACKCQRIQTPPRHRRTVPARRRIRPIRLQSDPFKTARPRKAVQQGIGQRHVNEVWLGVHLVSFE